MYCPTCLQQALPLTKSDTKCEFCNTKYSLNELKIKWINSFSYHNIGIEPSQRQLDIFEKVLSDEERIDNSFHDCLKCHTQNFTFDFKQDQWVCFGCATIWPDKEFHVCGECGLFDYSQNMNGGICSQCEKDYYLKFDS